MDGFICKHGHATRILNWWVASSNSATAQGEVHEWAVRYVANAVSHKAGVITHQGILWKPVIDNGFVEDFSFKNLYQGLQNQFATVTTYIFESLATSSRQLAIGLTPARMGKKRMVFILDLDHNFDVLTRSDVIGYHLLNFGMSWWIQSFQQCHKVNDGLVPLCYWLPVTANHGSFTFRHFRKLCQSRRKDTYWQWQGVCLFCLRLEEAQMDLESSWNTQAIVWFYAPGSQGCRSNRLIWCRLW